MWISMSMNEGPTDMVSAAASEQDRWAVISNVYFLGFFLPFINLVEVYFL